MFPNLLKKKLGYSLMTIWPAMIYVAYCQGHNSSITLIECQHIWLKWLDRDADFVRVFSFDFGKSFDSASHSILCAKLVQVKINPCVINWLISFLRDRKLRVVVDGIHTAY